MGMYLESEAWRLLSVLKWGRDLELNHVVSDF